MNFFKKIIFCAAIVFALFSLPLLVSASPIYYETYYGYTRNVSAYGYDINPNDGSHLNKTAVGFNQYITNNSIYLNFGQFNAYQGYQIDLYSNMDLDLTAASKYRLEGEIDFQFKPSQNSIPSRFYIQIGFDDVNYNHQIIKSYYQEEISYNLVNGHFIIRINEVFDALHEEAVSKLQINFNFLYPESDTSGNFNCTVSEFKITPTLANDANNVIFGWDSYVENNINSSMPFNQITYDNGVSYEFGQGYNRAVYAVHAKARNDKTLVAGFPYQVSGTVSIKIPGLSASENIPQRIDVVIGNIFVSYYDLWEYVNVPDFDSDFIVLSFDNFGVAAQEELDIYIRIAFESSMGSDLPDMRNSNFIVTVSPFNFRYVSAFSSEYNDYLSSEQYLADYSKFQFQQSSQIMNDALAHFSSLSSTFSFIGSLVTHGISSIPFLSTLFSISLAIGLGAFLFGLFSIAGSRYINRAKSFISNSKNGSNSKKE